MKIKLTKNPLSRNPALIRSVNGKALTRIVNPVSVFWTYDDHGEEDPALEVWCLYRPGASGIYVCSAKDGKPERLNLHGLPYPLYTSASFAYFLSSHSGPPVRIWAQLQDEHRSRGMTFWFFGKKIHITARLSDLVEEEDTFMGRYEISGDRRVTVNGEYCGIWPYPS